MTRAEERQMRWIEYESAQKIWDAQLASICDKFCCLPDDLRHLTDAQIEKIVLHQRSHDTGEILWPDKSEWKFVEKDKSETANGKGFTAADSTGNENDRFSWRKATNFDCDKIDTYDKSKAALLRLSMSTPGWNETNDTAALLKQLEEKYTKLAEEQNCSIDEAVSAADRVMASAMKNYEEAEARNKKIAKNSKLAKGKK